jgi:hypothetical protein
MACECIAEQQTGRDCGAAAAETTRDRNFRVHLELHSMGATETTAALREIKCSKEKVVVCVRPIDRGSARANELMRARAGGSDEVNAQM